MSNGDYDKIFGRRRGLFMERFRTIWTACLSAALASMPARPIAAQAPLRDPPSTVEGRIPSVATQRQTLLARFIEQLDSDSYDDREAASRQLADAGPDAAALVSSALNHASPEVRFRAARILEAIERQPVRELEKQIVAFAQQSDEELDVERGMCLIARILDPQVRAEDLTKKLDEIAGKVRSHLGKESDPAAADPRVAVAALRQVLYDDYQFRGNRDDYNNPDNCSLAFVLATRKGKPVLLGQLIVAVARRLKLPMVGVPVTGQYLVKYDGSLAPAGFSRDDIYLHPYDGGRILSREDRASEFPHHDPDRMVPPATNRETVARILRNIVADLDERDDAAAPYRRQLAERMLDLLEPEEG